MEQTNLFISYSHKDEAIVSPITRVIRAAGAHVFQDIISIPPGKQWQITVEDSLENADTIFVFWSRHSKSSEAVENEWRRGVQLGKDIIPILLDETDLTKPLDKFQWIDFRPILKRHSDNATGQNKDTVTHYERHFVTIDTHMSILTSYKILSFLKSREQVSNTMDSEDSSDPDNRYNAWLSPYLLKLMTIQRDL